MSTNTLPQTIDRPVSADAELFLEIGRLMLKHDLPVNAVSINQFSPKLVEIEVLSVADVVAWADAFNVVPSDTWYQGDGHHTVELTIAGRDVTVYFLSLKTRTEVQS